LNKDGTIVADQNRCGSICPKKLILSSADIDCIFRLKFVKHSNEHKI